MVSTIASKVDASERRILSPPLKALTQASQLGQALSIFPHLGP